jgi:hypothetical protein
VYAWETEFWRLILKDAKADGHLTAVMQEMIAIGTIPAVKRIQAEVEVIMKTTITGGIRMKRMMTMITITIVMRIPGPMKRRMDLIGVIMAGSVLNNGVGISHAISIGTGKTVEATTAVNSRVMNQATTVVNTNFNILNVNRMARFMKPGKIVMAIGIPGQPDKVAPKAVGSRSSRKTKAAVAVISIGIPALADVL